MKKGKPKRFLLFLFPDYYPSGGWNDFADSFDSVAEAKAHAETQENRGLYRNIVDTETGEDVS